jgi:hypothetical protein
MAFKLVFLLLALFVCAVMFLLGFSDARSFRKDHLESGEIDWQRYRQRRLWSLGISVFGAILAPVGLSTFVTNVGPLGLIGLQVQSLSLIGGFDVMLFFVALFGGLGLLGAGLGFGIGSLVFPVKKLRQIETPCKT